MNLANNNEFKNLFNSIKERIVNESFHDSETLKSDIYDCINNMIIQIEYGNSDTEMIGYFLPKINREFDESIPSMAEIECENGIITLYINPLLMFAVIDSYYDFVNIIEHEIYHLIFKHFSKERKKYMVQNSKKYNYAADCSVNQYIHFNSSNLESRLITLKFFKERIDDKVLPKQPVEYYWDLIPDDYFENDDEEDEVTKKLKDMLDELKKNPSDKDLRKKIADFIKDNFTITNDITNISDSVTDQIVLDDLIDDCIQKAHDRGTIPSNMEKMITDLYFKQPIISWKNELRHVIGSVPCPYKKTMRVKNRRQMKRADILGKVNDRKINMVIAIDTSGSVSDEELKYFFNEVYNITKDVNCNITLIQCDANITSVNKIKSTKNLINNIKINGRGGTYFYPVFEYINKMNKMEYPNIVLYFTDGYGECSLPVELKKNFELMWILTGYDNNLSVKTECYRKKIRLLNIENRKYL